jgi:hypothetical protein
MAEREPGPGPQIQWATVISAGSLVLGILGAFWIVAFGPIAERFASNERQALLRFGEIERRLIALEHEIDTAEDRYPTRREFELTRETIEKLSRRIDELHKEIRQ